MPGMVVHYTQNFLRKWNKMGASEKRKFRKRVRLFQEDCFDPRLKTHKLKGKLTGLWSFSVDYKTRALFKFKEQNTVLSYDIGSHQIYR